MNCQVSYELRTGAWLGGNRFFFFLIRICVCRSVDLCVRMCRSVDLYARAYECGLAHVGVRWSTRVLRGALNRLVECSLLHHSVEDVQLVWDLLHRMGALFARCFCACLFLCESVYEYECKHESID